MIWEVIEIVKRIEENACGKWNPKGYNKIFVVYRKFWKFWKFCYKRFAFVCCVSGTFLCVFRLCRALVVICRRVWLGSIGFAKHREIHCPFSSNWVELQGPNLVSITSTITSTFVHITLALSLLLTWLTAPGRMVLSAIISKLPTFFYVFWLIKV